MGNVVSIRSGGPQTEIVLARFVARYASKNTKRRHSFFLHDLIRSSRKLELLEVTEADLTTWIGNSATNNTARGKLSTARTFYRWAMKEGHIDSNPAEDLGHLVKSFPTTYGKVQAQHPARFLTYEEAYVRLVGACQDGTYKGLRDELVIRLGLTGLRSTEIRELKVREVDLQTPRITTAGKANRIRKVTPGTKLVGLISDYLHTWQEVTGKPPATHSCLVSAVPNGAAMIHRRHGIVSTLAWGTPIGPSALAEIVKSRARQADLGYVAPHDLRRTAATILHNTFAEGGGHLFDILDVQNVLDHADPTTTVKAYIEPSSTKAKDRAASYLD